MKFRIPFTISRIEKLRKKPKLFKAIIKHRPNSKLEHYLANSDTGIDREEYLNVAYTSTLIVFILVTVIATTAMALINVKNFAILGPGVAILFSGFVLFSQLAYPKIYTTRKEKDIERNLIPALQDIFVQLNSGVPIFSILVNISSSKYGELSKEFQKAVKKINAGYPQVDVLEQLGENSSSVFFRRTLWQISNGMKSGSDLSIVVRDSIKNLNEEQIIQIQNYGNKLNPLIMFYMLISVILPALAITFLTIVTSIINLPQNTATLLYVGMFIFVVLIQVMFLGVIRSSRPSLL